MPNEKIHRILRYAELPELPFLYRSLDAAIEAGESVEAVSRIIKADPTLAESLLKLANSTLYAQASAIARIQDAVAAIGARQIGDLALALLILRMFDGTDPDIVSVKSYWRHSFACGLAARILATLRGEANVERFFLAGLLHDIGGLLFYVHIPEQALIAILRTRNGDGPLHLQERAIVGFDHAHLGKVILQSWHLPATLQEAVEYHHAPDLAPQHALEATVLHTADIIVNAMQYGSRGEFIVAPLSEQAWNRLQLPVEALAQVVEQIDYQFHSLVHVFFDEHCGGIS